MTKKRKTSTSRKKSSGSSVGKRRRRTRGLSGVPARSSRTARKSNLQKGITDGIMDVVAVGVGAFAAAKGASFLDKTINKSGGKAMGMVSPGIITVAGVVGSAMLNGKFAKSLATGLAVGGALKVTEKAMGKDNLLSGLDDDGQTLMLPGVGNTGIATLPELPHYSENPNAPVTATGSDYEYHMGMSPDVMSGGVGEKFIAY